MTDQIHTKALHRGFRKAKAITKHFAKTFYFASHFLPLEKKKAAYAIYAVCRLSDESVDADSNKRSLCLDTIREKISQAYNTQQLNDDILYAFSSTVKQFGISRRYFDELINGMNLDLHKCRYESFEELYAYCYKVAGVVGLAMLKVFGASGAESERHAVELGIAMQLTNILRDISEDYKRGRIYIPQVELQMFKVTESDIADACINADFTALMKYQIQRARAFYLNASKGIKSIKDLRSRIVVLIMKEIYSKILDSIEENKYNVFTRRAHVKLSAKLITALAVLFRKETYEN
jgi:15-cis-phytoene synthase